MGAFLPLLSLLCILTVLFQGGAKCRLEGRPVHGPVWLGLSLEVGPSCGRPSRLRGPCWTRCLSSVSRGWIWAIRTSSIGSESRQALTEASGGGGGGDGCGGGNQGEEGERSIEAMYLRALGSLVTRRFSPRGIPRTQSPSAGTFSRGALGMAAGRPARSLLALRDAVVGHGALGAGAVAASVGLAVYVYLKDKPAVEEAGKEEGMNEEAYKARFEDWMKENDRIYRNEEEKAMRYEIFKKTAMRCDKRKALKERYVGAPNCLADLTHDELKSMRGTRRGDRYMEEEYIVKNTDQGKLDDHQTMSCREAVTQKQLATRPSSESRNMPQSKQGAAKQTNASQREGDTDKRF
ncbi:hypothetical protein ACP70R_043679 [Stipagrostis hirtigluma subsp. patula]